MKKSDNTAPKILQAVRDRLAQHFDELAASMQGPQ